MTTPRPNIGDFVSLQGRLYGLDLFTFYEVTGEQFGVARRGPTGQEYFGRMYTIRTEDGKLGCIPDYEVHTVLTPFEKMLHDAGVHDEER